MRCSLTVLLAGVVAGVVHGQDAPQAWLSAQYPNLQKVAMSTILQDATAAGLVGTPQQALQLKRQVRQLRGKDRSARPLFKHLEFVGVEIARGEDGVLAVEHETNDGWRYADAMVGSTVAAGDCSGLNDVDSWQFESTGGFYTVTVSAAGATPIADSILYVRNAKGDPLAFNDNAVGSLSQVHMFLPAGTYYADVAGFGGAGGGTYELSVQSAAVDVIDLDALAGVGAGVTQPPLSATAHNVFQFTLAGDSHSLVRVASGGQDTVLTVQRDDGMIHFVNDDSFLGGLDATADVELPAGTYYLYVSEIAGLGGVPYSITQVNTALAMPEMCVAGIVTNAIDGDETVRLVRVDLAAPQNLDIATSDNLPSPIGDTVMTLLDRNLDFICDVDDDDPFDVQGLGRQNYSRIAMALPAGTYYVAVTAYPGAFGAYTLAANCGDYAPTGAGNFQAMPGELLGFGDIATYPLENCSDATTRMLGDDFFYGLLGPDGELASCTLGSPGTPQAGEVPAGTSTIFIWDRYDFNGPLTTNLTPPLYLDAGAVTSRSKEGDLIFLFAEWGPPNAGFNFGVGDRGLLCLPTGPGLITFDVQVAPADGLNTWWTPPAALPIELSLQTGDAHLSTGWNAGVPALITWRNVVVLQ